MVRYAIWDPFLEMGGHRSVAQFYESDPPGSTSIARHKFKYSCVYFLQIHEIIHIHCVVNLSSLNIAELLINVQSAKNELFSDQCPVS